MDLSAGSWKDAFKRTRVAFKEDKLTDWAAALTYFGILAIFPALLVVVSVLGLIGDSATNALLDNLEEVAPGPAQEILENAIKNLQGSADASGVALVIGLGAALWASSSYVNGFMSASNSIYDVDPAGSLTKTVPMRLGLTVLLMVLAGVIAFAVVLTGGLAKEVGNVLGIGDTAVDVWNLAKWPVLLLLVSFLFAVLYWGAPNVKLPFRLFSPGALLAVLGWVIASVPVRVLRLELLLLQQDLRGARRADRVPALALDLEHLHTARRRAQRRARAQPQARGRGDNPCAAGLHRAAQLTTVVDLVIDVENTPGALAKVATAISDAGVNIAAATCIGPGDRAELHLLVPYAEAVKHLLAISHLAVTREREVVVVDVEDRPGVLADLTRKIARAGVDLDLVYVATRDRVVFGARTWRDSGRRWRVRDGQHADRRRRHPLPDRRRRHHPARAACRGARLRPLRQRRGVDTRRRRRVHADRGGHRAHRAGHHRAAGLEPHTGGDRDGCSRASASLRRSLRARPRRQQPTVGGGAARARVAATAGPHPIDSRGR